MAEPKTAKHAPSRSEGKARRKKKAAAEPRSRGIAPDAIGSGTLPAAVSRLAESIEADGGSVLAPYKDPLGGPVADLCRIDLVEPTPYQRDLSTHVERLAQLGCPFPSVWYDWVLNLVKNATKESLLLE